MLYNQPYDQPTLPDAPYVNGSPVSGVLGSIPSAAALEYPQREVENFVVDSDMVPTNSDLHQLSRGVQYGAVCFGADVGTANALSAVMTPIPNALYVGMVVRIKKSGIPNTGASTLDIGGGTGTHAIKRAGGTDVVAGDLPANTVAAFIYDGSFWQLINFQGFSATSTTTNNFSYIEPYVVDTGTANNIIAIFSPVITTLAAGDRLKVKIAATNTGPTTITVNSIAAKSVIRYTGISLLPNDIRAGQVLSLVYDGTAFQILVNSPLVWMFDVSSAPGSPATLLPGEYGILTFSNQTLLDFHVGLSPGTYSVEITCTSNNSHDSNNWLRPNGTTYGGKISTWAIQTSTRGGGGEGSGGSPYVTDATNVNGLYQGGSFYIDIHDGPWNDNDTINDQGPLQLKMDICTIAPRKQIRMASGIHGGPAIQYGVWNDGNAWTTLGKWGISVEGDNNPNGPFATISGRATVRRWS